MMKVTSSWRIAIMVVPLIVALAVAESDAVPLSKCAACQIVMNAYGQYASDRIRNNKTKSIVTTPHEFLPYIESLQHDAHAAYSQASYATNENRMPKGKHPTETVAADVDAGSKNLKPSGARSTLHDGTLDKHHVADVAAYVQSFSDDHIGPMAAAMVQIRDAYVAYASNDTSPRTSRMKKRPRPPIDDPELNKKAARRAMLTLRRKLRSIAEECCGSAGVGHRCFDHDQHHIDRAEIRIKPHVDTQPGDGTEAKEEL